MGSKNHNSPSVRTRPQTTVLVAERAEVTRLRGLRYVYGHTWQSWRAHRVRRYQRNGAVHFSVRATILVVEVAMRCFSFALLVLTILPWFLRVRECRHHFHYALIKLYAAKGVSHRHSLCARQNTYLFCHIRSDLC